MPLILRVGDGNEVAGDLLEFNQEANIFLIKSSTSPGFEARVRYVLPEISEFTSAEFLVQLFKRHRSAESEIYQVYDSELNSRIGWMIPLAALESTAHGLADNRFFCNYAYIAYEILLKGLGTLSKIPEYNPEGVYSLSEFYDEDSVALIVSKNVIASLPGFEMRDYNAALMLAGYTVSLRPGDACFAGRDAQVRGKKRLAVRRMPACLRTDHYLKKLFAQGLLENVDVLVEFFLLYQIVELLLDRIFQLTQVNIVTHYLLSASPTLSLVKDLLGEMKDVSSDKQRMSILFGEHLNEQPDLRSLKDSSNAFLREVGVKEGVSFESCVYPVRNKLVHELRGMSPQAFHLLSGVNDALKEVLPKMLLNYIES